MIWFIISLTRRVDMSGTKRTRKRAYFIEERRETYLDCLRVTGSHRAAAREAGVSERAS